MLAMQVNHSSTFPSSTPDRLLPSVSVLRRPPFSIPRLSFAVFILLLLLLFLSLSPTSLSFSSLSPSAKQRHTRLLSPSHTIRISLFVPLSFPQHFQRDFAFIRESLSFFFFLFFSIESIEKPGRDRKSRGDFEVDSDRKVVGHGFSPPIESGGGGTVEDGSWSSRVVDQGEFDPWNVEWNACVYFKKKCALKFACNDTSYNYPYPKMHKYRNKI